MDKHPALISGASAGIGSALAEVFAEHGHDVLLAARRQDKLETLAGEIERDHGVHAHVFPVDLGTAGGAVQLHDAVRAAGIQVGILVNNAGVGTDGLFLDVDLERHRQTLAVNANAVLELCHLFGRDMRECGHGRILNVASTSAFQPVPRLATYAATKAFLLSFSEALAAETADSGVTVTALCPGFVKTDMTLREGGKHFGLPGIPVLEPREVAEQGYRALMHGRTVYINGLGNQLLAGVSSRQPRWLMHRIGRLIARREW